MQPSVPATETQRKVAEGGGRRGTHKGCLPCGLLSSAPPPSFCLIHKCGPEGHDSHLAHEEDSCRASDGGDGSGKPRGAWVHGG